MTDPPKLVNLPKTRKSVHWWIQIAKDTSRYDSAENFIRSKIDNSPTDVMLSHWKEITLEEKYYIRAYFKFKVSKPYSAVSRFLGSCEFTVFDYGETLSTALTDTSGTWLYPVPSQPIPANPPIAEEKKDDGRSRHWCWKLPYSSGCVNIIVRSKYDSRGDKIKGSAWTLASGHIFGLIIFDNPVRPASIRNIFGPDINCWIPDSVDEARVLATAGGLGGPLSGPFYYGNIDVIKHGSSSLTGRAKIVDMIRKGSSISEISLSEPQALLGCRRSDVKAMIEDYNPRKRTAKTRVHVIVGDSGLGKSYHCRHLVNHGKADKRLYYIKPSAVGGPLYVDKYQYELTGIWEEFGNGQHCRFEDWLLLGDENECPMQVKGDRVQVIFEDLAYNTRIGPWKWYPGVRSKGDKDVMLQLYRRIDFFTEYFIWNGTVWKAEFTPDMNLSNTHKWNLFRSFETISDADRLRYYKEDWPQKDQYLRVTNTNRAPDKHDDSILPIQLLPGMFRQPSHPLSMTDIFRSSLTLEQQSLSNGASHSS